MKIKRCLQCGNLVLKKSENSQFCSVKCEKKYAKKSIQTNEYWFNKTIDIDVKEKTKKKEII